MPELRLFVDAPLAAGAPPPALSREQIHYVLNVMRRRAGDQILLFNGRDGEWRATLTAVAKRALELELAEPVRPQVAEPGPALWFAPIRRARQEMLIEKATELGVTALHPVLMRRSVVEKVNLGRQRAILIEAAEQSGRLTVPPIEAPVGFDAVIAAARGRPILWADEASARLRALDSPLAPTLPPGGGECSSPGQTRALPLLDALRDQPDADLLIGPEGGFDPEERAILRRAPGILPVSLGPRILRAETAALAALAGCQLVRSLAGGDQDPRGLPPRAL